jgi:adenylylsulfate kinase
MIVALDVPVVYLLTGRLDLAVGFTVVSNLYASIAYYFHERIWNKIGWGKTE